MSQLAATPAEPPQDVVARARWTWLTNLLLALAAAFLLIGLVAGAIYWRFQEQHQQALADVQAEVDRIQAAGEPITIEDLDALNRVPDGANDTTELWLAAIRLGPPETGFRHSKLPYVGSGKIEQLKASAPNTLLGEAEAYLARYEDAVAAARRAAAANGECRYPIDFSQGLYPDHAEAIQPLRQLSRLLALRARVGASGHSHEEAIESIELLLALAGSLEDELDMTRQLVRMLVVDLALLESEFLIAERSLSDEQLGRLQTALLAIPTQEPARRGLLGERGMGYQSFRMKSSQRGGPASVIGDVDRPAECLLYLHMMQEMLDAADRPRVDAIRQSEEIHGRLAKMDLSPKPRDRSDAIAALQSLASLTQFFAAWTRVEAERESAVAGAAFRRFQWRQGRPPASLAAMTPEFLAQVPTDPFQRGASLIFLVKGNQFAIYSVGMNGTDDQALLADPDTQVDTGLSGLVVIPAVPMRDSPMRTEETSHP
ncbi:MAG TPA: hypothetical protein VMP01_12260 [Pirellulaceae bacterium]|nr:hypothetical protein [Pirellulaceae bacterium]